MALLVYADQWLIFLVYLTLDILGFFSSISAVLAYLKYIIGKVVLFYFLFFYSYLFIYHLFILNLNLVKSGPYIFATILNIKHIENLGVGEIL